MSIGAESDLAVFGVRWDCINRPALPRLACSPILAGEAVIIVGDVKSHCKRHLLCIADADGFFGGAFSLSENWEEDSGEDCYDRDHDEEFDEGKPGSFHKLGVAYEIGFGVLTY